MNELDERLTLYLTKLLDFYNIYWRTPSKREFTNFISPSPFYSTTFSLALAKLNFQTYATGNKPTCTIEVIDLFTDEIIFIGTPKDVSDEFNLSSSSVLVYAHNDKILSIYEYVDDKDTIITLRHKHLKSIVCEHNVKFRVREYEWRNVYEY